MYTLVQLKYQQSEPPPLTSSLNTIKTMTFAVANPDPDLRRAHKYGLG
jgi:hypothetical protein